MVRTFAFLATVILWLAPAAAAERTIIVLDASGSMWGQIDGKPKLEIARDTLRTVLKSVPSDTELGLMAYGHREKGSCSDIQLVVPPAKGTEAVITSAVDGMKFMGKTPLSASVKQAAEELKYTEDKATVILITDGLESCSADPCAVGKELEQTGVDFTAHVVGFGLTAEEGSKVACLAETTGGKYIQASDASALEDALKQTVAATPAPEAAPAPAPAPEPAPAPAQEPAAEPAPAPDAVEFNFAPKAVLKAGDQPIGREGQVWRVFKAKPDGTRGDDVTTEYDLFEGKLEPGDYVVEGSLGHAKVEQPVKIEAGKTASPVFDLNAGTLVLRPRSAPGADIASNATLRIMYPGAEYETTEYGERRLILPAGEQKVTVQIGAGSVTETVQLAAGQVLEKDIIVGVGRTVFDAFYTAGGEKIDSGDLSWRIYKAQKKLDGTREQVTFDYGAGRAFELPAGDYLVEVQMQGVSVEQPFSVTVGQSRDMSVALSAGVLSVTASGASEIRILEAKADLQGERGGVTYGYGETFQTALAAGDYIVVTAKGEQRKETPVTIKAGERSEVKVE